MCTQVDLQILFDPPADLRSPRHAFITRFVHFPERDRWRYEQAGGCLWMLINRFMLWLWRILNHSWRWWTLLCWQDAVSNIYKRVSKIAGWPIIDRLIQSQTSTSEGVCGGAFRFITGAERSVWLRSSVRSCRFQFCLTNNDWLLQTLWSSEELLSKQNIYRLTGRNNTTIDTTATTDTMYWPSGKYSNMTNCVLHLTVVLIFKRHETRSYCSRANVLLDTGRKSNPG